MSIADSSHLAYKVRLVFYVIARISGIVVRWPLERHYYTEQSVEPLIATCQKNEWDRGTTKNNMSKK